MKVGFGKHRYLLFFLFGVGLVLDLYAQQMPAINYTTHNGLPQIQVQKLFQDSQGYIWVGTKGGVAKFNGEHFSNYLSNEYTICFAETEEGEIYVGSRDNVYHYHKGEMHRVAEGELNFSICPGKNNIWIIRYNRIEEYRNDSLFKSFELGKELPSRPNYMCYDKASNSALLNCSNNDTLYAISEGAIIKKTFIPGLHKIDKLSNSIICLIIYDKSDRTYKATSIDLGTTYFTYKLNSDKEITDIKVESLPVNEVVFKIWNTSFLLSKKDNSAKLLTFPIIKAAFDVLYDKDSNFWVATDNGLYQIGNNALSVFPREFLNDVWTFLVDDYGTLYAGEYMKGLYKIDLKHSSKQEIIHYNAEGVKETDFYYGASKDLKGNLFFPTQNGILKYNSGRTTLYPTGVSTITRFDPYSHKVLIGTEKGFGFLSEDGKLEKYIDSTGNNIKTRPSSFEFAQNGDIWIGSWNQLALFSRSLKRFIEFDTSETDGLRGVITMAKDYRGNIWFGGTVGLWMYSIQSKKIKRVDTDLFNNYILSILIPDSANLIVGTSYEIYAIDLQEFYKTGKLRFKLFNHRNGFIAEEIAQNGMVLYDEKVFIPSTTYTSVLDYKNISYEPEFYNILVTSINDIGLSLKQQKGEEAFKLKNQGSRLYIKFESIGFGLPRKNSYKYILEGYDKAWSDWTGDDYAQYIDIPSGEYTFRVFAKNGSSIENTLQKESTVKIKLSVPFYKEPSFYKSSFFITMALITLLAYLSWIYYRNTIKASNREKQIKYLEIATLQAQINPHFIFNFLSTVQSLIDQKNPEKANTFLVKFSRLMRAYMESSIKHSKMLMGMKTGNEITLKEDIELLKIYIELEQAKYKDNRIQYSVEVENESLLHRTIPPMVLQPFVENAIKHGILPAEREGHLLLRFYQEDDVLICIIQDDGIGREASLQNRQDSIVAKKSRGLELIRDRIKIMNELGYNIGISFSDPPDGGTVVTIKIQS